MHEGSVEQAIAYALDKGYYVCNLILSQVGGLPLERGPMLEHA